MWVTVFLLSIIVNRVQPSKPDELPLSWVDIHYVTTRWNILLMRGLVIVDQREVKREPNVITVALVVGCRFQRLDISPHGSCDVDV